MRNNVKKLIVLSLAPMLISLAGCSASTSSGAHTVTFTVTFLDDAGNNVGFKYVHYGESIEYASPTSSSSTVYDFKSKSATKPTVGYRYGFDKWSGSYDENSATEVGAYDSSSRPAPKTDGTEAVDPSNIKGSCTVKANFKEVVLTLATRFKNGSQNMMATDGKTPYSKSFNWGDASITDYYPTDPTRAPAWGHSNTFSGYLFTSASSTSSVPQKASGVYYHGAGAPSTDNVYDKDNVKVTSPVSGAFYEDTDSYILYAYDGVYTKIKEWNTTAYASNTTPITVTYYADYLNATLNFTSRFYSSKDDYDKRDASTSPSTPIGKIESSYAKELVFSLLTKKVTGEKADGTYDVLEYPSLITKEIRKWAGTFDSDKDTNNMYASGDVASDYAIMANASFYPIFRDQKVVFYPSKADADASTNPMDVVVGSTTQKYAYIDFGSALVYDDDLKTIKATDAEANSYTCSFSSITGTIDHWVAKLSDGTLALGTQEASQDFVVYPVF